MWAISTLASVMTQVSLPVMGSVTGGSSTGHISIAMPNQFYYCVMGEAATVRVNTFLNKTFLALVNKLGIEIRIAHYPPYTSKYNPIEHRLFPHLSRACQGVIFESVEMVRGLMSKTKTQTGLKVFATVGDKLYKIGRKVTPEFKATMEIVFDEYLPQWNYTAKAQTSLFSGII